jgi:hypothetical protein
MRAQRTLSEFPAIVVLTLLPCAAAFASAQERFPSPAQGNERRFSVVHAHVGNNCAGYLYVSQESVRYDAMVPPNFKDHSFQIRRADILALQPWILMGQPQNIVEIKTARGNYHFWVLPDGMDLGTARGRNLNLIAAPAADLIAAVRNPEAALTKATTQTPARSAEAGSAPSAKESGEPTPANRRSSGSNDRQTSQPSTPRPQERSRVSTSASLLTVPTFVFATTISLTTDGSSTISLSLTWTPSI